MCPSRFGPNEVIFPTFWGKKPEKTKFSTRVLPQIATHSAVDIGFGLHVDRRSSQFSWKSLRSSKNLEKEWHRPYSRVRLLIKQRIILAKTLWKVKWKKMKKKWNIRKREEKSRMAGKQFEVVLSPSSSYIALHLPFTFFSFFVKISLKKVEYFYNFTWEVYPRCNRADCYYIYICDKDKYHLSIYLYINI